MAVTVNRGGFVQETKWCGAYIVERVSAYTLQYAQYRHPPQDGGIAWSQAPPTVSSFQNYWKTRVKRERLNKIEINGRVGFSVISKNLQRQQWKWDSWIYSNYACTDASWPGRPLRLVRPWPHLKSGCRLIINSRVFPISKCAFAIIN